MSLDMTDIDSRLTFLVSSFPAIPGSISGATTRWEAFWIRTAPIWC